jgi:endonuclease-3 related protein
LRWVRRTLEDAFGPQGWWPGDGPFEVMVGAVLTQNTSWRNVEHALKMIRDAGAMDPETMAGLSRERLERLARPAGFFRRKARTLSILSTTIVNTPGGLAGVLALDAHELRKRLLAIEGVGPETADSILVYAAGHPTFVADGYARRFASRHAIAPKDTGYGKLQALVERALGHDANVLAEFHALLVQLGKRYCRTVPRCPECPLRRDLPSS